MRSTWFRGIRGNEELEKERRLQVVTAAKAFEVLSDILRDKVSSKEGDRNKEELYGLPGYPFFQADASGYIRALNEVLNLIDLKE
jgi:hypothetical protein